MPGFREPSFFLKKNQIKQYKSLDGCHWRPWYDVYQILTNLSHSLKALLFYCFKNIKQQFFIRNCFRIALSPVNSIWNILVRPERKIVLRQKIFGSQFYYSGFLLALVEVPFCYRMIFERTGIPWKVTISKYRHKDSISPKNVIL